MGPSKKLKKNDGVPVPKHNDNEGDPTHDEDLEEGRPPRRLSPRLQEQAAKEAEEKYQTAGDAQAKEQAGNNKGKGKVGGSQTAPLDLTGDNAEDEEPIEKGKGKGKAGDNQAAPVDLNGDDDEDDQHEADPLAPATDKEKLDWPGWVEMSTESGDITVMLHRLGTQGLRAYWAYDFSAAGLNDLQQPVYALIFCYQYGEGTKIAANVTVPPASLDLWFAHQLGRNACGPVALMNALMNLPMQKVDNYSFDTQLRAFKDKTLNFTPHSRGQSLNRSDFIRQADNACARKTDMLSDDYSHSRRSQNAKRSKLEHLKKGRAYRPTAEAKESRKEEADEAIEQAKADAAAKKKKASKKMNAASKKKDTPPPKKESKLDETTGNHFVAYIPVNGRIYLLDGMDEYPHDIGPYGPAPLTPWPDIAEKVILDRIEQYGIPEHSVNVVAICPENRGDTELVTEEQKHCEMKDFDYGPFVREWLACLSRKKGVLKDLVTEARNK